MKADLYGDWPAPFAHSRVLRGLAIGVTLAFVTFALATLRTIERGRAELTLSDAAFDRGELVPALQHARRAAAAYVPSAAHVPRAYERLRAVARGAERARDLDDARAAWQAMRAAAVETGHLWQPHGAERVEAERNLERLGLPGAPADSFGAASGGGPAKALRALLLVGGLGSATLGVLGLGLLPRRAPGLWAHARPGGLVVLGALCAMLSLLFWA